MKSWVVALLLIGASGCTARTSGELDTLTQSTVAAMHRGDLSGAQSLSARGLALTNDAPSSEPAWRFKLLTAEVLVRKHDLPEARRLLAEPPPAGANFDALRARHDFVQAFAQVLDGQPGVALQTLERGTAAAPAGDGVRLDIDLLAGAVLYQLGRGADAEARLNEALATATRRNDHYHQAGAQLNLGFGQLVQKRYDAALTWFERVLALEDQRDLTFYADALNNAGICYARLGQFDRAIAAQQRAVQRHEGGARREYEQALGQLGTTYVQKGEVGASLPYLQQALTVATSAGLSADAALWAGNLASAYVDLGDWDHAERFNDEAKRLKRDDPSATSAYYTVRAARIAAGRGALDAATRLFDQALAAAAADPWVQWSAHEGLASVAVALKRPAVATRHFEIALQTIEKTRSDVIKADYRLSFLSQLISFYRKYVDALIDQGQIERALEVADSSRGRVLAERQGVTSPARARAATFRQRAAASGTVFLSYWLSPTRSYLWVVSPARVELVTLPPSPEIEALVRDHRGAIDDLMADPLKPGGAGDRLFQVLVEPAVKSIPIGHRVVVVPDGALYALNFETLPVPASRRHYWIEDVELQLAPSLAMLERPSAPASRPASPSLLLIGNPTPRAPEFPALKYAGVEMTNIARHFPAAQVQSFEAERADPAAYRDAHPDRFSLVHFTAHATTNVESPLDSAVILSGPESAFKLYARDVAAQPLHADLVTVSACRSAGERTYSGEGLVGFAWAFLRGGAKRVIAGLWDVDDRSTAELMDRIYGRLADGATPSQALREAKLALLQAGGATARPYYWAPFELFTLSP